MDGQELKRITKIIKAVADENRARIIYLLKNNRDICVCEITHLIGLAQPTISSHLKLLENAGLIESSRKGLWMNYNISGNLDSFSSELIETICKNLENDKQLCRDMEKLNTINRETICRKKC